MLSHRTAAAHWRLRPDNRPSIDVSVPGQAGRRRKRIEPHRSTLHRDDVTVRNRIPCTSVGRTLLDLADLRPLRDIERAVEQAERLRLFDLREVDAVLARAVGRHGASRLREAIAAEPAFTRGELEELFLALCRRARLPRPRVNVIVAGYEVDFSWPVQRLAVETDGYADHTTRRAFERDPKKARALVLAKWRVVRFTWREIAEQPASVAAELSALLR